MKLVLIAIFSVILLVVCEPQQEALAEDTSGLYYNFDKSYGWNLDSNFDKGRYDEVDHNQRADRNRVNKLREEGDRDYDREEDQNRTNDRNREKQRDSAQNDNRTDDRNRFRENYRDLHSDDNERYNKRDKNGDGGNDNVDSNKDDKGRSDKNKDYSKEDRNRDKYRKKENGEENNRNGEKNFNQKTDYSKQESGKDKNNGNKNYERQNQYDKINRDDKNIQREFDKQDKDRGDINNNGNNNFESNYKNDKDRNKEKEGRKKDNTYDTNDKYEYDSKENYGSNSNNNKGRNNANKDDRRWYQEEKIRDDKQDKEQNYYSDKNNVGSNKKIYKGKDEYSRESEYKDSSSSDDKDRKIYNNNQYNEEKQSKLRSKSESYSDNKEKAYTNRAPGYGYSYLESLITAPKPNSDSSNAKLLLGSKYKENRSKEQGNGKKEEVIEIHGYISKGVEQNDKQVEVDVIVKKADTALGTGLDSKGFHIHKVLNHEVNEKGHQIAKPQSELKYEYIKPENKEKNYRELFNNHVQDKKDLLGGIEILGLLSNIGQEIKEQVIEKIPGYNIIQKLDPRRQKTENKQEYKYDQDLKYPKIDLEVYYPPTKQYEDGGKKVKDMSYTEFKKQDKEIDVYARDKNTKEMVSKYFDQDRKVQVIKKIDTNKSADKSEKSGKHIYNPNKGITLKKEKEVDIRIKTDKGNQEVKGNQREGKKESIDYTIRHKETGFEEKKAQKYITSHNYNKGENNEANQHEVYYNSGNSYKKSEKSDITQEAYNHRQNEGYQDPNYLYEPLKDRGINYGIDYQGPGNLRQPDRINPLQDYMKNKQREEKYVYDYTIGNLEKQGPVYNYNMPYSKGQYEKQSYYSNYNNYRPDNWYEYNSKHNYDPNPNEGWSYQGFPINDHDKGKNHVNNFPQYEKDKDDQGIIRIGNLYGYKNHDDSRYREPFINRGYPNYILPNYNQGILGGGFGLSFPYPLPNLINPLSQQILGSAGRIQEYYHQNYTKNLGNLPHHRDYNLYNGESKSTESYPNYEDAYTYYEKTNPVYDTTYQSSNNEYVYQYQLPYATAIFSVILLVTCEPQRGRTNDEQLTTKSNNNRNEDRYRNDRRREGNERNLDRDNEERDQREYRNQGRERSRGNQASDNVDGRVLERHGAYQGSYGYPYYEREIKKEDRRRKEYKNREYAPYYPNKGSGSGYLSADKNDPNYDFYETFPYPDYAGRRGLGFQRRTYLVNGYTSPITKELLEIVGKRRDFEYDKNYHRISDYYDLYEPKYEPKYDDKDLYYGKKEYKYEGQDLYKTPYPAEMLSLEYQKGLTNGFYSPIGREFLETVGKHYNYNSAHYPNLY